MLKKFSNGSIADVAQNYRSPPPSLLTITSPVFILFNAENEMLQRKKYHLVFGMDLLKDLPFFDINLGGIYSSGD